MPLTDSLFKVGEYTQEDGSWILTIDSVERDDYPELPDCERMKVFRMCRFEQIGDDLASIQFLNNTNTLNFDQKDQFQLYATQIHDGMGRLHAKLKANQ